MRLTDLLSLSLRNALRHPLRSLLAALSVVVGIAAVATITAGELSWQQAVDAWYEARNVDVINVHNSRSGGSLDLPATAAETRKVLSSCPSVSSATPYAAKPGGRLSVKGALPGADWCYARGVLPGFEQVFATHLLRGRFLTEADEKGRAPVCILDPRASRLLFGDTEMVGREIRVGGHRLRVVGIGDVSSIVAGPGGVAGGVEAYADSLERNSALSAGLVMPLSTARRTFGMPVTALAARAENHAAALPEIGRYFDRDPYAEGADQWVRSRAAQKATVVEARQRMRLFIGMAGMLVLFASGMGLASVMYVAVSQRQRQIGVHRATGATSRAVAGTFLLEGLWLSGLGGLVGVVLGFPGSRYFGKVTFPRGEIGGIGDPTPSQLAVGTLPEMHVSVEWPVVAVAGAIALAIAAFAGYLPASEAARLAPSQAIRSNPPVQRRLRQLLTGLQLAAGIAAVLLLSSMHEGIALGQLGQLAHYSQADTVTSGLTSTRSRDQMAPIAQPVKDLMRDPAQLTAIAQECPSFRSVEAQVDTFGSKGLVLKWGRYATSRASAPTFVSAGFLPAEGARLLEGRFFGAEESARGERVVVLTDHATAVLQMDRAAGETIRIGGVPFQVVGVVRRGVEFASEFGYIPVTAAPKEWTAGYPYTGSRLRAHLRPDADYPTAERQLLTALAKRLPKQTMEHLVLRGNLPDRHRLSGMRRAAAIRASVIGFSALLIALIGLVNMLLVSVSEQTREIGLRRACGASRTAIAGGVVREALLICLPGCAVGLGLGIAAAHFVGGWAQLDTAVPMFWIVVSAGTALLGGLLASLIPAIRAAMLHPVEALRTE